MSLTTRCPNCKTLFKVVPDQLRIAAGWVRCGYCSQVFDGKAQAQCETETAASTQAPASDATQATASPTASPAVAPGSPTPNLTAFAYESEQESTPPGSAAKDPLDSRDGPTEAWHLPQPQPTAWPLDMARPEPKPEPEPGLEPELESEAQPAPDSTQEPETGLADIGTIRPAQEILYALDSEPALESRLDFEWLLDQPLSEQHDDEPAELQPLPTALVHEDEPPSFVLRDRQRAVWRSRPMRAALWLALLVLLAGLTTQLALQQRDWLAARHPELAPVLAALCKPWRCQLEPYRQLAAVVIDSSSFNRQGADSFGFNVNLRNRADLPIATPSLELTLTDINGSILVRRVITPEQLSAPTTLLQRGEFNGNGTLHVAADAHPDAIVNYRLVAFYP